MRVHRLPAGPTCLAAPLAAPPPAAVCDRTALCGGHQRRPLLRPRLRTAGETVRNLVSRIVIHIRTIGPPPVEVLPPSFILPPACRSMWWCSTPSTAPSALAIVSHKSPAAGPAPHHPLHSKRRFRVPHLMPSDCRSACMTCWCRTSMASTPRPRLATVRGCR